MCGCDNRLVPSQGWRWQGVICALSPATVCQAATSKGRLSRVPEGQRPGKWGRAAGVLPAWRLGSSRAMMWGARPVQFSPCPSTRLGGESIL